MVRSGAVFGELYQRIQELTAGVAGQGTKARERRPGNEAARFRRGGKCRHPSRPVRRLAGCQRAGAGPDGMANQATLTEAGTTRRRPDISKLHSNEFCRWRGLRKFHRPNAIRFTFGFPSGPTTPGSRQKRWIFHRHRQQNSNCRADLQSHRDTGCRSVNPGLSNGAQTPCHSRQGLDDA